MWFRYLWTVLRHKWFVFWEACKLGIPWLGLIHDWSKFLPAELFPYARWFYGARWPFSVWEGVFTEGDTISVHAKGDWTHLIVRSLDRKGPIVAGFHGISSKRERQITCFMVQPRAWKDDFDLAWNHHQKRNKHHWQYWLLILDHPQRSPEIRLEMPRRYVLEMIADWRGAGKAYGTPDTKGWYLKNRDKMKMHPNTRKLVDRMIGCEGEADE